MFFLLLIFLGTASSSATQFTPGILSFKTCTEDIEIPLITTGALIYMHLICENDYFNY